MYIVHVESNWNKRLTKSGDRLKNKLECLCAGSFKHWLLQKRGGKTSMVGTIAEHLSIITLRQENGSVQRKCREGRCRELVSGSRHTLLCENMKKITLKDIYIYIYIFVYLAS